MIGGALLAPILLSGVLASCARMEAPSGGPEDNRPPVVIATEPDTFAVVEGFEDPVVIRFSERISENPQGGTVDDAVVVSPATSEVEVDFQRSAVEISLEDGFEVGHVYRVRVNPVVVDMFSNPMVAPFELVFSTGPEYSSGAVAGVVLDRITGEPASAARVHARPSDEPDAAPNVSRTDEEGIFALRYLPAGSYEVTAFEDQNRSGALDPGEARQIESVTLGSASDTVLVTLEVLAPDTTPAQIVQVEAVDSAALRIDTDDVLNPSESLDGVEVALSRAEGIAPEVEALLHAHEWEARMDSLAELAAEAEADTAAGGGGGAPADDADDALGGQPPAGVDPPDGAGAPSDGDVPRAEQEFYALLGSSLEAGVEYTVSVSGIVNIAGTPDGEGEGTVIWEPPPPDTTSVPPDSAGADGDATDPDDPPPPPEPLTVASEPDPDGPGAGGLQGGGGDRPAVFLDRDGTLIRERDYLADPEGVELVGGTVEALAELREAGFALIVTTNQSGIARGYYTAEDYRAVATRLDTVLREAGAPVDATYHCPHHPDETGPCGCRKPAVGMHREAIRRFGLDPERSWFVGDKLSDLIPARTLGGRGILVRTGYGTDTEPEIPTEFLVADDIRDAARVILGRRGTGGT